MKYAYIGLLLSVFLVACSDKSSISEVLDLRDSSISQQNLNLYASLHSNTYPKADASQSIENMKGVFSRFDTIKMKSRDRVIQIIDDEHAICEQTYILQVRADGEWRKIVQREQLKFHKDKSGWKISSGL